jgi:hypothetical protein
LFFELFQRVVFKAPLFDLALSFRAGSLAILRARSLSSSAESSSMR